MRVRGAGEDRVEHVASRCRCEHRSIRRDARSIKLRGGKILVQNFRWRENWYLLASSAIVEFASAKYSRSCRGSCADC